MPMLNWMGLDGWLFMLAWVVILGLVVWALVRDPRRPDRDEALDILRARYARGELSADEFARALQLLKTQPMQQEGIR